MHPFARLSMIALLLSLTMNTSRAAETSTPLSKALSYKESVVTIRARQVSLTENRAAIKETSGAGVVMDPSGLIVTNTHIVYGANSIDVIFRDGTSVPAQIPFISRDYDFVILKIPPPYLLKPIQWAATDQLALGQPVITIGHSPLLDQTMSGGQISGLGTHTQKDGSLTPEMIKININHYPGDSGGPVFNLDGQFIGLMNAKRVSMQRAALAIPAGKIYLEYIKLVNGSEKQ